MAPAPAKETQNIWLLENGPGQIHELLRTLRFCSDPSHNNVSSGDSQAAAGNVCCLCDIQGNIASWDHHCRQLFGLDPAKALYQHISVLYPVQSDARIKISEVFQRAIQFGHCVDEIWQQRADGHNFRGEVVTLALSRGDQLQGFARSVSNVSNRYESEQKQQRTGKIAKYSNSIHTTAGVANGNVDRVTWMNRVLLDLIGCSESDLSSGDVPWKSLTPASMSFLDESALQEALRHGASTPYEKTITRRDGTQIPVLTTIAILQAVPLQWVSIVHDLRPRQCSECIEGPENGLAQDFGEIVGVSSSLRRVQRQVEVVAPTDATVLILGETGTGKELIARAIHRLSPRYKMPFITLNCAAIPTGLLESELFGYERGAFTGALAQKIGRFEMAHCGTLFLDEVGDIPIDLQPKLLRALQEKSFERLGGTKTIPIDVRLVAATNRNLAQMMEDNLFRSDLYYRLKVFPITTPPLRERSEDIPELARHFTKKYSQRMNRQIESIPTEVMSALIAWPWPGNVRELENFIERSVILSPGPALRAPIAELRGTTSVSNGTANLEQVEREHILKVLRECKGVVTAAATKLGLHRTTLNAMIKKLGLVRRDFC